MTSLTTTSPNPVKFEENIVKAAASFNNTQRSAMKRNVSLPKKAKKRPRKLISKPKSKTKRSCQDSLVPPIRVYFFYFDSKAFYKES